MRAPVVPVTVCAVAEVALVVNVTVAIPLVLVVDVGALKDPPPDDDHVTMLPGWSRLLLLASVSCALMVTAVPAIGVVLVVERLYFDAAPAVNATSALLLIASALTVPVIVAVPLATLEIRVAV